MKAMIFAAGLGTRLRPLTDTTPKALISVGGRPMLERVILKLKDAGFDKIIINIHYLGEQIIDFLRANNNFGVTIHISDEREKLLDTGGGIKKARSFLESDDEPFLVHNVDILSNIDLKKLYQAHVNNKSDATLLVNKRDTSRYLLFDKEQKLHGWINTKTEEIKPYGFCYDSQLYSKYAFNGIHVISTGLLQLMDSPIWGDKFSIIDFYLEACTKARICGYIKDDLQIIDIGKPESLAEAEQYINKFQR
jgi:MurNAc alpha-1-phosphate uridylyltransferase